MKRIVLVLVLTFTAASFTSWGWGVTGHKTIVEIAKNHLSEKAKAGIASYMPYDIANDAVWMDKHRKDAELLYMFHFHEQCINIKTLEYDPNPQIDKGDMMRGLRLAEYNLSHRGQLTDSVVVLNLRMLLHFMGDLHCPVHLGIPGIWFPKPPYRQDVGKWYYREKAYQSFHKFIDLAPGLLFPDMSPAEIAVAIDKLSKKQAKDVCKGDFVDWTNDSVKRGFRIYQYFPPLWEIPDSDEPKYIPDDFLDNTRGILTEELLKAGYQLSYVLNKCFE